ncbi:MAG: radical SAM family heme chaperone HemW [Candidatus Binatia bacterium]
MPFSLYIHIPYCLVKCPYCDFNAYGVRKWPEEQYVEALSAELRHYASEAPWQGEIVETIYFGGGTPSLFAPSSIRRFLQFVSELFPVLPQAEITLEADPASVTPETLAGFRDVGVTRLSFGVQSFQPMLLKTLGRLHTAEDGPQVLAWAREVGFTNLNMDLIFGVPGQTLALLEADLAQTFASGPDHISLYNLTYEEGTPFFMKKQKGQLQPVDEDEEVAMFSLIRERCLAQGYRHYEISNFARPRFASRHNANYWKGGKYLGLGAGAHSFSATPDWGQRWQNEQHPSTYVKKAMLYGHTKSFAEILTRTQARGEFLFLNLRQLDGVALAAFTARFGSSLFTEFPHTRDLIAEGLLHENAESLALTPKGVLVADAIFASFF